MSDKKEVPRDIEILPSDYEPTQAEMNEVFSIDATPEVLAKAAYYLVFGHQFSLKPVGSSH